MDTFSVNHQEVFFHMSPHVSGNFQYSELEVSDMWAKGDYQEWLAWDPEREVEVSLSLEMSYCLVPSFNSDFRLPLL